MAQTDYLFKKLIENKVKTDSSAVVISSANELLSTSTLVKPQNVWLETATLTSSGTSSSKATPQMVKMVSIHGVGASQDYSGLVGTAWSSGVSDWIDPSYNIQFDPIFYVAPSSVSSGATVISNGLTIAASTANFTFDYKTGNLTFLGPVPSTPLSLSHLTTTGNPITNYATTNSIWIKGYTYNGLTLASTNPNAVLTATGAAGPQGLTGPQGATGVSGTQGSTGASGATGPSGTQGATGVSGTQGSTGASGATGPSGTQGATGVSGTQGASGATGPSGTQGATGVSGTQGASGATGPSGTQGATGVSGTRGTTGASGATGPSGTQGATGVSGTQGSTGASGATGPSGTQGATGVSGTQGSTGASGATGPSGTQGATGVSGTQGSTGASGATGPSGTQGATGVSGTQGSTGASGATGPSGTQGATGVSGTQGSTGASGATGPSGTQGATGVSGTQGSTGASGATGPSGTQGATGVSGTQGSTGASGATGPSGTQGATGVSGTRGTTGASGATGPSGTQGATGVSGTQGSTGASGATGPSGTQGATGVSGTQGSTGASGATGPSGTQGATGVSGTQGSTGASGATGPSGTQGATGVSGTQGSTGASGATGPSGTQGATGVSGTRGTTGASGATGPSGTQGATGVSGTQGSTGASGATGPSGTQGATGVSGTRGTTGASGATGPSGTQGATGVSGTQGSTGASGATGPSGTQGATGVSGTRGTTGASGATGPSGTQGATGVSGTQGSTGASGATGPSGTQGATGVSGTQGSTGASGATGPSGTQGATGVSGTQGSTGASGATGPSGTQGATGVSGTQGSTGASGATGPSGTQGATGVSGTRGTTGASGATGPSGTQGATGVSGTQGSTGASGATGPSGTQGATGVSGTRGTTGASGATGPSGTQGATGVSGTQGSTGASGATGPSGTQGATGVSGTQGSTGASGATGPSGTQGATGVSGTRGTTGASGATGPSGTQGATGVSGTQGSTGASGATGPSGTQGATGVSGTQGSTGASGATGPSGTQGATGVSGTQGSTGASGATGPSGTQGATGVSGTRGTTGASGATGPSGTQGATGVSGTQGSTGASGATGPSGTQGATGVSGTQGSTGASGATGPSGTQGATGVSGTQGSTGASGATGPSGTQGATGVSGTRGTTGASGATGPSGTQGATGVSGTQGSTGASGATGPSGTQGATGVSGTQGSTGASGATGPSGTQGATGVSGTRGTTGASGATGPSGTQGATGVSGTQGSTGASGATGPSGTQGATGVSGTQGSTGASGATGPSGTQGATGVSGTRGTTGASGATGPSGTQGATGVSGTQGSTGASGATGPSGTQGATGVSGTRGTTGASGATGPSGTQGATGVSGTQGSTGASGATGPSGTQGATGVSGTQGSTGASGATGPSGTQGATGVSGTQGSTGASGATGPSGTQGATGVSGTRGTTGASGATGPSGTQGATGVSGTQGSTGASGATGPSGTQGATGVQGLQGLQGATGPTGVIGVGATGATGASGVSGQSFMFLSRTSGPAAADLIAPTTIRGNGTSVGSTIFTSSETINTSVSAIRAQFSVSSEFFAAIGSGEKIAELIVRKIDSSPKEYKIILKVISGSQLEYFNDTTSVGFFDGVSPAFSENDTYAINFTSTSVVFSATSSVASFNRSATTSLTPGIYRMIMNYYTIGNPYIFSINKILFYGAPYALQGVTGASGAAGPSSSYFTYRADDGVTPSQAHITWSNFGTQSSSTYIRVNHIDRNGVDIDIFLNMVKQGDKLIIQDANVSANFQTWLVNGTPIPNNGSNYVEYPVTLVTSGGSSNFSNTHPIIIALVTTGVQGFTGPSGAQGVQGVTGASGVQGFTGSQGPTSESFTVRSTGINAPYMEYSLDGKVWSSANVTLTGGQTLGGPYSVTDIAWNGSLWIAGITNSSASNAGVADLVTCFLTSTDGINWTTAPLYTYTATGPTGPTAQAVLKRGVGSIAWNGSIWVAIGPKGLDDNTVTIAYSRDGYNWTAVANSATIARPAMVRSNSDGTFICAGSEHNGGQFARSVDGINWQTINVDLTPAAPDGNARAIGWNGTYWVSGVGGTFYYTSDSTGLTGWTQGNIRGGATFAVRNFAWNGTMWLAGCDGSNTTLFISFDSINWFRTSTDANEDNKAAYGVTWNGSIWILNYSNRQARWAVDPVNGPWNLISSNIFAGENPRITSRRVLPYLPQRVQGVQGVTGPSGVQGVTGPSGVQGVQGVTGVSGVQGVQGVTGPSGVQGVTGPEGATFMTLTKFGAGTNATLTSPTSISSNGTGSTIFVSSQTVNTSNSGIVIEFTTSTSAFYTTTGSGVAIGIQLASVSDPSSDDTSSYDIYIQGHNSVGTRFIQFRKDGSPVGSTIYYGSGVEPLRFTIRTTPTSVIYSYVTNTGNVVTDATNITHGTYRMRAIVNGPPALLYTIEDIRFYGIAHALQGVTGASGVQGVTGPEGATFMTLTKFAGNATVSVTSPTSISSNGSGTGYFFSSQNVITSNSGIVLEFTPSTSAFYTTAGSVVAIGIQIASVNNPFSGDPSSYDIYIEGHDSVGDRFIQFRKDGSPVGSTIYYGSGVEPLRFTIRTTPTSVIYSYVTNTGNVVTDATNITHGTYRMRAIVSGPAALLYTIEDIRFYGIAHALQGVTGPSGAQGGRGVTGVSGVQGVQGVTGPSGAQGGRGVTGVSGVQGVQGVTGPSGVQGITGPRGPGFTSESFTVRSLGKLSPYIVYSEDGKVWNSAVVNNFPSGACVMEIAWNGVRWIAALRRDNAANPISTNFLTSADGITWYSAPIYTYSATGPTGPMPQIINNNVNTLSWNGTIWVAGAENAGGTGVTLAYSTDGYNWTAVANSSTSFIAKTIRVRSNKYGRFLAVGAYGGGVTGIATSTDGINWTSISHPQNDFRALGTDGEMWVTAYGVNTMYYTLDNTGTTGWTLCTIRGGAPDNIVRNIEFNGSMWVATTQGDAGAIFISFDGINWSQIPNAVLSTATVGELFGLAWNGHVWLAGNRNGITYWSADPFNNWTLATPSISSSGEGAGLMASRRVLPHVGESLTNTPGATFMTFRQTVKQSGSNSLFISPTTLSVASNTSSVDVFVSHQSVNTSNSGIVAQFSISDSFYGVVNNLCILAIKLTTSNLTNQDNSYSIAVSQNGNVEFRENTTTFRTETALAVAGSRFEIRTTRTGVIYTVILPNGTTTVDTSRTLVVGSYFMALRCAQAGYSATDLRFYGIVHGFQGVTGPSGVQGVTGPSGAQGFQGVTGPSGVQGPAYIFQVFNI